MNKTILFSLFIVFLTASIVQIPSLLMVFQPNGDGTVLSSKIILFILGTVSCLLPTLIFYIFYKRAPSNPEFIINLQEVILLARIILIVIGIYLSIGNLPIIIYLGGYKSFGISEICGLSQPLFLIASGIFLPGLKNWLTKH